MLQRKILFFWLAWKEFVFRLLRGQKKSKDYIRFEKDISDEAAKALIAIAYQGQVIIKSPAVVAELGEMIKYLNAVSILLQLESI